MGRSKTDRVQPHSLEAEASVLGAILLRNDVMDLLADLTPDAFFDPKHRAVFAGMQALAEARTPIDEVTLEGRLRQSGHIEAIGGLSFLSRLALKVPTADNAEHWADMVREKHAVRSMVSALSDSLEAGYGDYGDLSDYQAEVLARVDGAIQRTAVSGPTPVRALVKKMADEMDRRHEMPEGVTGVPTGFVELDHHLSGQQPDELTILAARPAMGKTALSMCIARRAAQRGHPVIVFSLEMSSLSLLERLVCSEAGISTTALRKGQVERRQQAVMAESMARLAQMPIEIDETPALSHHEVRARARRFAAQQDKSRPGLIVVDYLQLMRGRGDHSNREQEIAEISRALKALAKDLHWPVLALSQLNRSLESRSNKRPQLSDLRESGAIEQDADIVLFLYRDEVYYDNTPEPGVAEVIVAKHRGGPAGVVKLRFDAAYTRFRDMDPVIV